MKKSDLRALQFPLMALTVTVALGVGLPYYSDLELKNAQRELAQHRTQLGEARTRLQKSGDEKEIIVRYLGAYQYLQRLGFVGAHNSPTLMRANSIQVSWPCISR
jgi:hypothetical protein